MRENFCVGVGDEFAQMLTTAASYHPLERLPYSKSAPRCEMCRLVEDDPELCAIVTDTTTTKPSRACFRCRTCDKFICGQNPVCYLKHIQNSATAKHAAASGAPMHRER